MHVELFKSTENLNVPPTVDATSSQPTSSCISDDEDRRPGPMETNNEESPDGNITHSPNGLKKLVKITSPESHRKSGEEKRCARRNSNTKYKTATSSSAQNSGAPPSIEDGVTNDDEVEDEDDGTRVYVCRYVILAIFIVLSASNAMQWIEYSIIAPIVKHYYGVEYWQVDWTSMIYMLTYMVLVFPGSWFLDRFGLRQSVLIGALGNCAGAWLKMLSLSPDRFWLTFIAQTIVGASQVFILGIPPRLAAVWFGTKQVSTACAFGVFGNQLGIAIGFVLPPWLVHMGTQVEIASGLRLLFLSSAFVNTIVLICIALYFREKPPHPPSLAQARAIEENVDHEFFQSLKRLVVNRNYMILLLSYGINVGVFYAVSTLLSQMVLYHHPDAQEVVGTIGLLIVVSGMLGSVVCGYALDRFHLYKSTTLLVYLFSYGGMVLFTFTVSNGPLFTISAVSALLGFFMTGYLPLGFEFAAELTFPIAEGTTSGLLNAAVQAFGVAMTIGMGKVMESMSIFWANFIMSVFLLIGLGLTALIKADLRRQNAHNDVQYTRSNVETSASEA